MKSNFGKVLVIIVLLAAIAGVLALKSSKQPDNSTPQVSQDTVTTPPPDAPEAPVTVTQDAKPPARKTAQPTDQRKNNTPVMAPEARRPIPRNTTTPAVAVPKPKPAPAKAQALPRLLELGADKCVPCKMMQPVLAELRQEYGGKLQVDFIDVWKDAAAGEPYGIRAIPTQIFFAADGKEIFRHTGFYPKEEILAKFKELGISL